MTSSRTRNRCRRSAGRGCKFCKRRPPCRTSTFRASSRKCCRCSSRSGTRSDCTRIARRCRRARLRTADTGPRRLRRWRQRRCCRSGSHRSNRSGRTPRCIRTSLARCSPGHPGIVCRGRRPRRRCCRSSRRTAHWSSSPRRCCPRSCKRHWCTLVPPRTSRTHFPRYRKRSRFDCRAGRRRFLGNTPRRTRPTCTRTPPPRRRPAHLRMRRIEVRRCRIDLGSARCTGYTLRSHCSSRWDTRKDCRHTCRSHRTLVRPRIGCRRCPGSHRRRGSASRKHRCSCSNLSCSWGRSGTRLGRILDLARTRRSEIRPRRTRPASAWGRTCRSRRNNR